MSSRLQIDWTRCKGRGLCIELLPEVLTNDDWGYPMSRYDDSRLEVPRSARGHAVEAVKECPRLALRLIED
jgi:ferredoxin